MGKIMRALLTFFLSLRTAIWLLIALLLMLLYGSLLMPSRHEFSSMDSIPLFNWLRENPFGITWWLYISMALLSLLTANTIACSIEALIKKRQYKKWLLVIAPQIIHIGFLCILLAHLLSSAGSFRGSAVAYEGSLLALPNNLNLKVNDINIYIGATGYITDWNATIEYFSGGIKIKEDCLKPNAPSFYRGFGIYIKDIRHYPVKAVLLELSQEPGAVWALIGGIFFMLGTIILLLLKIKREPY